MLSPHVMFILVVEFESDANRLICHPHDVCQDYDIGQISDA
jgi:hypothetical protein